MVEDDERRSHSRTGLVLNDELVMLELPVEVALLLHLVECVAAWRVEGTKQQIIMSVCLPAEVKFSLDWRQDLKGLSSIDHWLVSSTLTAPTTQP